MRQCASERRISRERFVCPAICGISFRFLLGKPFSEEGVERMLNYESIAPTYFKPFEALGCRFPCFYCSRKQYLTLRYIDFRVLETVRVDFERVPAPFRFVRSYHTPSRSTLLRKIQNYPSCPHQTMWNRSKSSAISSRL